MPALSTVSKISENSDTYGFQKYITIGDSYIDSLESFAIGTIAKLGATLVKAFGYSGERTDQILVNLDTDGAYASGGTTALISTGMNDLLQNRAVDLFYADICTMIDNLKTAGIAPIFVYIAGTDLFPERNSKYNMALLYACYVKQVRVFDAFSKFQVASGGWDPLYTTDGTHPNALCKSIVSNELAEKIKTTVQDIYIPNCMNQESCVVPNPIFFGDANADGVADGWTKQGAGGTMSLSPYLAGNKQVVDISNDTSRVYSSYDFTGKDGHVFLMVAMVDMELGALPRLSMRLNTPIWESLVFNFQGDGDGFKFMRLLTVGEGGAGLVVSEFDDFSGDSKASIYGIQAIDLTELGLIPL